MGSAARADAGVVDHHGRWTAEPVLCVGGQTVHVVDLCDVAAQCQRLAALDADRVGRCLGGVFVDVAAHHPAATLGEFDGEGRADTAARAGDDGGSVAAALIRSEECP